MDILQELLGPIPIPLLGLIIFGLVFGWMLSRFMRMPAQFKMKEELREEIRFRLTSEGLLDAGADQQKAEDAGSAAAAAEGSKPESAANDPAATP
jgi:hypothetical protein